MSHGKINLCEREHCGDKRAEPSRDDMVSHPEIVQAGVIMCRAQVLDYDSCLHRRLPPALRCRLPERCSMLRRRGEPKEHLVAVLLHAVLRRHGNDGYAKSLLWERRLRPTNASMQVSCCSAIE